MSATLLSSLSVQELTDLLESIDTVLVDCDGVLWLDTVVLEGASNTLDLLRSMGKRVFYVTNNSTKSRDDLLQKFHKMGFTATKDEVMCTSYMTACYLNDIDFQGKVYVIGHQGLGDEIEQVGIKHSEIGPDVLNAGLAELVEQFQRDPEIKCVVVGFDVHFNYVKMLKAASYLKDPECIFIATNTDETFPMKTDLIIPGAGSVLSGIEKCTGREAFKIGKPSDYLQQILSKYHNVNPKKTLMIGDRGNTDILLGSRCGFKTLLVLTGVTNLEEVKEWQKSDDKEVKKWVPDFYLNKLSDLIGLMKCICSKDLNQATN